MRPYVFSVDVFGTTVDVDMDRARETLYRRMERAKVRSFKSIHFSYECSCERNHILGSEGLLRYLTSFASYLCEKGNACGGRH